MRFWYSAFVAVLVLVSVCSGCGPSIPREELGEVMFELPKVAPSDSPYDQSSTIEHGHDHPH